MNNLVSQNDFKGYKEGAKLNEMVERIGDNLVVTMQIAVPQKLVKQYSDKVKAQTGRDILTEKGDSILAETIVRWVNENLLTVDNLSPEIVLGEGYSQTAQVQPQAQPVQTAQEIPAQETQGQGQVQVQTQGQGQGQGQGEGQVQVQTQTQPQGQGQGQGEI